MSVALVVLDTLRKDAFDDYFDWLPGRRFEHAWSTSHWTMPAHASLFTGKYASEVGTHAKSEGLECSEPVLAELLRDNGIKTRAFSANLMISPSFGFDRGFDTFDGQWRLNVNNRELLGWSELSRDAGAGFDRYYEVLRRALSGNYRIVPSLRRGIRNRLAEFGFDPGDDDGAAACLRAVRNGSYGDNEFLFINLMEAHAPYRPPKAYRTVEEHVYDELAATVGNVNVDGQAARASYDDAVRYLADIYRRIFAVLSERFEHVITVGDHGELFGEHGKWRHIHGVYPELTHIPLVVSGGGLDGNSAKPASLVDIHRTVLDLAGIDAPSRGRNLLDGLDGRPRLVEFHGLRPGRIEMMRERGCSEELIRRLDRPLSGFASESYYGYETPDRWEERGSPTVDAPYAYLHTLRNELSVTNTVTGDRDISEEMRAQLRALGYA